MVASLSAPDHAALMDRVYRGQRHIYDLTRKYYLFGRDRLIRELDCRPGMSVLELGCGTGRNLELILRAWPGVRVCGLDISGEMLKNAHKRLDGKANLALGDARDFDPTALFGNTAFDRVVLSYAVSMIPDWQAALARAAAVLAPRGSLHVVDFGDGEGIPRPLRGILDGWLAKFHVSPRRNLPQAAESIAQAEAMRLQVLRGPLGYYQLVRLTR